MFIPLAERRKAVEAEHQKEIAERERNVMERQVEEREQAMRVILYNSSIFKSC